MRRILPLSVAAAALIASPSGAAVKRAETVLPPGQSGFVSLLGVADGTGSPHLYDQNDLFSSFRWKAAMFGQPGSTEQPRPGVSIVRDAYGIPSVKADSEMAMWWGAGYAVAQDRLFELELFRNATKGTLSEILGPGRLDDDRIVRRTLYTRAERDELYGRLPREFRARFEAYRDGVNAYMDYVRTHPDATPAEYPATTTTMHPWTTDDSVAIGIYLARTIPTNADPESLELSNMRGAQLGGAAALQKLVPLRTRNAVTTIPRSEGHFHSQPGRTRKHERAALKRSLRFVEKLKFPDVAGVGTLRPFAASGGTAKRSFESFTPKLGGSYMVAVRRRSDGHALLHNGPQLGFDAPEKVLELELHAPGIDMRGMTAPGVPVIGAGWNGHGVAWGITTGASDSDDLYAEQLVDGQPDHYRFRGEVRRMDCRVETLKYESPPSDLAAQRPYESGSRKVEMCRTVHGPVEARAGGIAYARRHAGWMRELETLEGLVGLESARDISDVDAAARRMTWNENLMAVDAKGNIGFWHPGLHPLRSWRWDERLPLPGTGEAEWRGLMDRSRIPAVINPRQGYLVNWNNLPSYAWTSGDGTARKRMDGKFFRVAWLDRLVRSWLSSSKGNPTFEGLQNVVKEAGTVAQQFPLSTSRLRRAAPGASDGAKVVLDTLLAWDGSYHRTAPDGTVDAGVAAWREFRRAAAAIALAPFGDSARYLTGSSGQAHLYGGYHTGADYHLMEASHGESFALSTLRPSQLREAAQAAFAALSERFGSGDPASWREPRLMYEVGAAGATAPPSIPFMDRGTYEQFIETGP